MTMFRATFTIDHQDGKVIDQDTLLTAFEQALDDVDEVYAMDDAEREGVYSVTVDRVEVVT